MKPIMLIFNSQNLVSIILQVVRVYIKSMGAEVVKNK